MSNFWPKKWSRSLKRFEKWSLTREFLKQYLNEKQVVAYEKWSLRRELTVLVSFRGGGGKQLPIHCLK